jgi:hypothetical protein
MIVLRDAKHNQACVWLSVAEREVSASLQGVILSLRRIWREADMQLASAIELFRARSFPQDDAIVGGFSTRSVIFGSVSVSSAVKGAF